MHFIASTNSRSDVAIITTSALSNFFLRSNQRRGRAKTISNTRRGSTVGKNYVRGTDIIPWSYYEFVVAL